jgi:outer membrane lipoprotein-sorting protein
MIMKKLFTLFAVAVAMFMASCAGAPATPSDAAVEYYQYVANGDYEAFADAIHFDTTDPEEIAEGKAMVVSLYKEKAAPQMEAKSGVKSVEATGETISEDGNTANVQLKVIYGDGSEKTEDVKLVKVDNKWLLAFDK